MTSKEALEKLFGSYVSSKCYGINYKQDDEYYNIITQDLDRFNELVKVIRILKTKKYAEWIKNKFYDGVGYEEEEEKLFKKVFGSSWRKY